MKIISKAEIEKKQNSKVWLWSALTSELKKQYKKSKDVVVCFSIDELRVKLNIDKNRLNDKRFVENVRTRARRTKINDKQLKVSTHTENHKQEICFYLE